MISKRGAVQGSAKKKKKTPGGFLFNGARRGSAPAVWFINGTQTRRSPLPLLPAPAADQRDGLDGMDVEACLLRKLFLAAGMANTRTFLLFLSSPQD